MLQPGRNHHCSIPGDDAVIITGGSSTYALVQEVRIPGGAVTPLPDLSVGRWAHACGKSGHLLVVAGGVDSNVQLLSHSEVYDQRSGTKGSWRKVGSLPKPMARAKAASLNSVLYLTGGWAGKWGQDSILEFDESSESWVQVGRMEKPRYSHALTEISLSDVFCGPSL